MMSAFLILQQAFLECALKLRRLLGFSYSLFTRKDWSK